MNHLEKFRNALAEWHDARPRPVLRLPSVLQFPVNDICNSHCQMCHIWQRKRDHEITPDELDAILRDPLFRVIRDVGINGGEPTLRPDLDELVGVLVARLPRLAGLSLITNSIRPQRVMAAVETVGRICREAGKWFDVMVSLDGIGEVHDRVRGVPGNFAGAVTVLDHLRSSPWINSHRIGCTIIAENAFTVDDVLAFARDRGVYARFRVGVPHPRLYTAGLTVPFQLDDEARFHVAAFLDTLVCDYERDPGRRAFYRSLRDQLIYERDRAAGCAWKNRGITLSSRGELSFCAVASPILGSAITRSALELHREGVPVLQEILREKCGSCRHDYDGIANRRVLLRRWAAQAATRLPAWIATSTDRLWREASKLAEWPAAIRTQRINQKTSTRTGRLLFCGWYGTETLGDRAILAGLCNLARRESPDVRIDVASLEPYVTEQTRRWMPELGCDAVRDLPTARRALAAGDYSAVAIAGGPLMTPVREVLELQHLFRAARSAGARTGILGCGIGPFGPEGARRHAIAQMVRTAEVCVLRDADSGAHATGTCGRKAALAVACDPAFFWEALGSVHPAGASTGPVVALALREWQLNEYGADLTQTAAATLKARLERELVTMVRHLLAQSPDVSVLPVCMHTLAVGGDDRMFYWRVFSEIPQIRRAIVWRRRSPHEELDLLRQADAICAMRFHSAVFALALQKPFVALDYTRGGKIDALLRATGNENRLIRPEDFHGADAAGRILSMLRSEERPSRIDHQASEETYRGAFRRLLA